MTRKFPTFTIGDRVAFSPAFLCSIHDRPATGMARQRGHVTHVTPPMSNGVCVVQVQWDDAHVSKSLNSNLIHAHGTHKMDREQAMVLAFVTEGLGE